MNVNEEMNQLGSMGQSGYTPSAEVVDQLRTRAKRGRSIRRGSAALVGSVGAVVLGTLGASVIVDLDQGLDAATNDRGTVEQSLDQLKDSKYGENDGYKGDVDVEKILEDIKIAAETKTEEPKDEPKADEPKSEPKSETTPEVCEDYDYGPDKPYKYWDCSKGEWRYKADWFQDPYSGDWAQCVGAVGAEYDFGYYDCTKGKWVPKAGYVVFHGIFAPCVSFTDAVTGNSFYAGYVDAGSWHKLVICNPSEGTWGSKYRYVFKSGGYLATASDAGGTCTGTAKEISGAPHQYSCHPHSAEWILSDASYKWFKKDGHSGHYFHQDATVEWNGKLWEWDGGQWVDVTPAPEPEPTATPSASAS